MPASAEIVVIGAGYAGVLAATRIARRAGSLARVTLVNPTSVFVERIRLHELAAGGARAERPLEPLLAPSGVRLNLGRVCELSLGRRSVVLDDGTALEATHVVLATGSRIAAGPAGAREHAHTLEGLDSARALSAQLQANAHGGMAVIGGGLTAIEAVTELVDAAPGLRAVLLCRGSLGEGGLGDAAREHVRDALKRRGIELREHVNVAEVAPGRVETSAGRLEAATVLWAGGFVASALASQLGLPCDGSGRLLVTQALQAPGVPWLWGAGDSVVPDVEVGAPIHMSCKTAMVMATRAADNVVAALRGGDAEPFHFGDTGVCVSLGRGDGVIQLRDERGSPRGVLRGRPAAWVKEAVCRATVGAIRFPVLQRSSASYDARGRRALATLPPVLAAGAPK